MELEKGKEKGEEIRHTPDTMSEPMVTTHARPTPQLLSLLCAHLPDSLPLLRRLQFAAGNPAGTTEHSRVLFSGSSPEDHDAVFAAAYVDVSRGPETEAWVYSSLEGRKTGGEDEDEADRCVLALLRAVRALRDEYDASNPERERQKPTVLFGTLGDAVRLRLLNLGVVSTYVTVWDKWVFRLAGLPGGAVAAAERHMAAGGMGWGAVESGEDARLVISRTKIPRQEYVFAVRGCEGGRRREEEMDWMADFCEQADAPVAAFHGDQVGRRHAGRLGLSEYVYPPRPLSFHFADQGNYRLRRFAGQSSLRGAVPRARVRKGRRRQAHAGSPGRLWGRRLLRGRCGPG